MNQLKKIRMSVRRRAAVAFLAVPLVACQTLTGARFEPGRSVEIQSKQLGGKAYLQNDKPLSLGSLLIGIERVPEAREDARIAMGWSIASVVLGTAGGAGILLGLGPGVRGGQFNWPLVGAGTALAIVSLFTNDAASNSMERATNAYNASLKPVSQLPRVTPW